MTVDTPTILAASGGYVLGRRQAPEVGPILRYAMDLSGATRPRVCTVNTAGGDDARWLSWCYAALAAAGAEPTHLQVYPMPNVADVTAHLLSCDVIWVGGGSVANLLALWRLHGYDTAMRTAWERGVVLGGVSAGSLCWHVGGTTDSFTPDLTPITNGLGLLPHSNCPHYDSEARRRPLYQSLIADGTLPDGFATDDGTCLVFRGSELVECVSDRDGAACWQVQRSPDRTSVVETRLEPRRLPA
ncbi:MAG TPA: peptidase E [Mycobacteriales bacterium]|nr:peptidase E [Mycobacteriales bacterium]